MISFTYGDNSEDEHNLKDIDDNVEGGIGDEHDVIPASQSFSPRRPLDDVSILDHLIEKLLPDWIIL